MITKINLFACFINKADRHTVYSTNIRYRGTGPQSADLLYSLSYFFTVAHQLVR